MLPSFAHTTPSLEHKKDSVWLGEKIPVHTFFSLLLMLLPGRIFLILFTLLCLLWTRISVFLRQLTEHLQDNLASRFLAPSQEVPWVLSYLIRLMASHISSYITWCHITCCLVDECVKSIVVVLYSLKSIVVKETKSSTNSVLSVTMLSHMTCT